MLAILTGTGYHTKKSVFLRASTVLSIAGADRNMKVLIYLLGGNTAVC